MPRATTQRAFRTSRPRRTAARLALALAAVLALGPLVSAQAPVGDEFQVNVLFTPGSQRGPDVAAARDGGFAVVWEDNNYGSVFVRTYDSDGDPAGLEFPVNTSPSNQRAPRVARGANGTFVVVWMDNLGDGSGYGIRGRRYDAAGNPVGGEFQVNTYTTGSQTAPDVASDASGNFVVVWTSSSGDGSGDSVRRRRFDAAGTPVGNDLQVNAWTTGQQNSPAIAMAANGSFVVVWRSAGQDGSYAGVFGRRFNSAGTALGGEFQVNTYVTGDQSSPTVASDANGNFTVAWEATGAQDGSSSGVRRRRFDTAGVPLSGELAVNLFTVGSQDYPAAASDAAGNVVVAWRSSGQDGNLDGVYARLFVPGGGELRVNSYTTSAQSRPAVAWDDHAGYVVVWQSQGQDGSDFGIFGQRYSDRVFGDGFQ